MHELIEVWRESWRLRVLFAAVIAALATPPDGWTMFVAWIPLCAAGEVVALFVNRNARGQNGGSRFDPSAVRFLGAAIVAALVAAGDASIAMLMMTMLFWLGEVVAFAVKRSLSRPAPSVLRARQGENREEAPYLL